MNPERGLFFFDASFRPVPLGQTFIGVKEKDRYKARPAATTYQDDRMCYPDRAEAGPHFVPGLPHMSVPSQAMDIQDELAWRLVSETVRDENQALIFVHARNGTMRTAQTFLPVPPRASRFRVSVCASLAL